MADIRKLCDLDGKFTTVLHIRKPLYFDGEPFLVTFLLVEWHLTDWHFTLCKLVVFSKRGIVNQIETLAKCLSTKCLLAKYLLVKCLSNICLLAKCLSAKCPSAKYLSAKCLLAKCLSAKCLSTKCLSAKYSLVKCLSNKCLLAKCLSAKWLLTKWQGYCCDGITPCIQKVCLPNDMAIDVQTKYHVDQMSYSLMTATNMSTNIICQMSVSQMSGS